jgi:hypothetical protein
MKSPREHVEQHYGRGRILDSINAALREAGKGLNQLKPDDLAPVDEFHVRGREATVELARRAALKPGSHVLDVGCGTAPKKFENAIRNLREGRFVVVQARAEKQ